MWYSSRPQSTYNRIFNFVVGVRGGGKTFNKIREAIEDFEKKGKQFVYLRRRGVDLDDACTGGKNSGDLFADIKHKGFFPDVNFKIVADHSGGYNFYYNDKPMGYGRALSTARRSTSLPLVEQIIFDEFLIDDSAGSHDRYLNKGNEMFLFNNFYETIARGRDIPCYFIGNAFSMVNPYFLELGIRINDIQENKIYKGKTWTLIFWKDADFLAEREKTQFYQATAHTEFNRHAFGNQFYLDNKAFLKKRSDDSEHQFSLVYDKTTYGVWVDWEKGFYYVTTKGAQTSKAKTISMSLTDNRPNNVNIRRYRNMPFMKAFRAAADGNQVFFDNQTTYNKMNEIIYLLKSIT